MINYRGEGMSNDTNLDNNKKYNESFFVNIAFVLLAFALLTTGVLIIFKDQFNLYFDFTELASLGSFLGGIITAFLTFSTILLVFATYKTQQKELAATREQLEETVRQAEITNETMLKQQFETTFFNMISMHNNLVDGLTLYNQEIKGRDVFIRLYELINGEHYNVTYEKFLGDLIKRNKDDFTNLYESYAECINGYNEIAAGYYQTPSQDEFNEIFSPFINNLNYRTNSGGLVSLKGNFQLSYHSMIRLVNNVDNSIINSFKIHFLENTKYKSISYDKIMSEFFYPLNHYYKSINSIIDFVNDSNLSDGDKERYLSIFTAIFNSTEITLLHYEGLLGHDHKLENNLENISGLFFENGLIDNIL